MNSPHSSAQLGLWRSLIPNVILRQIFGGRIHESLVVFSGNAWDGQFLLAEGLPIGCFDFQGRRNSARHVYLTSPEDPQKYAVASKPWSGYCSLLDTVMRQSKPCNCVQE